MELFDHGHLFETRRSALTRVMRGRRKIIFSSLAVFFSLFFIFFVSPLLALYGQAKELGPEVERLNTALANKKLGELETSFKNLQANVGDIERIYGRLAYLKLVPFLSFYYQDGERLLRSSRLGVEIGETAVSALKPHQENLTKAGMTAEEQLSKVVETLPKIANDLESVWGKLDLIQKEIGKVNPQRYPQEIAGVKIRFWLEEIQRILTETSPLVSRGKEVLELAPKILGSPKRTYLVIFQNDAELRATGGFITGYSLMTVEGGRILSNDFGTGAHVAQTTSYIKPPDPLGKYLRVPTWHFQDANYSPDFPTTSEELLEMWGLSKLSPVSGVVSINTTTVSKLLGVVGPISLPGYEQDLRGYTGLPESCQVGGGSFTEENLLCKLEYYVEKFEPERIAQESGIVTTEARKEMLGRLSNTLLEKIRLAPADVTIKLIDLIFVLLAEKDLMVYAEDDREQELFRDLGYAGDIKASDGDYLHVSDSNFGGLKTNMFLEESVEQELNKLEDGTWRKTVNIKYFNPQPYDNWLSGNYKDFVRLYAPVGSKLVRIEGASQEWGSWEELGKTVFGAFFTVWPQAEHTLTFIYDLPIGLVGEKEYKLLVQKQAATNIGLVTVKIGATMESSDLKEDRIITVPLK